jgi:thiol:disulfide interchange protein DsbD
LNAEGKPLNRAYSFDENISKYVDFLDKGLKNYAGK